MDGASYANANKQDEVYERSAVEPYRRAIETALNFQFVQPRFGKEFRVHYDRKLVTGLQEDRNEKSKRITDEWTKGVIKLNEARGELGYEPIEEEEGGNEFFRPQPTMMLPQPTPDDGSEERTIITNLQKGIFPKGSYGHKYIPLTTLTKDEHEDQRTRHERFLIKNERRFAKIIATYLNGQVNRLIERLREITGDGKFMSVLELYIDKQDGNSEIPDRLFDLVQENEILAQQTGIAITQSIEAGGNAATSNFNLPIDFNSTDPSVRAMSGNFALKLTAINDFSRTQVRQLLVDGFGRGDSTQEIAKNLRSLYGGWTDTKLDHNRSMRIARTEMNGMVNGGASEAYSQAGLGKEWLAVLDDVTRFDHVEAHGQRVGAKEKFSVGGDMLAFPSDPSGSPENIINCRCTMIPVIID